MITGLDHEEADSRIVPYVNDALQRGTNKILIHIVDTDVIVIFIGQFKNIIDTYPNSIVGGIWDWNFLLLLLHQHYLQKFLDRRNHAASHHFTHSQDVIPHLLLVKPRNQHGITRMLIQM